MFKNIMDANANWPKVQDLYDDKRDSGMNHNDAIKTVQKAYNGVGPINQRRLQNSYVPKPVPKPDPKPDPNPDPEHTPGNESRVISTLNLKLLTRGGGDWNIPKADMKRSKVVTFKGRDAVECVYGKNSGTSSDPGVGGFSFTAKPNGLNHQEIAFSWQVWYPKGFQWARGGKHGGIFVGTGVASGYRHSPNGASNRIMWKQDGGIIDYIYPSSDLKQKIPGLEPEGHGIGFFEDEYKKALKYDTWNTIEVATKMNTFKNGVPQLDGVSYVIVNGKKCVLRGINWSSKPNININNFGWNSFFGGPLPSPVDQKCYFSNFQMKKYEH